MRTTMAETHNRRVEILVQLRRDPGATTADLRGHLKSMDFKTATLHQDLEYLRSEGLAIRGPQRPHRWRVADDLFGETSS